ncbi:MAG: hypothetical protein HYW51_01870 [Candidatus Doudnabacteria bacterium]|nr:hypothetical protein [Candidatus Doudnabacteria bacterium]
MTSKEDVIARRIVRGMCVAVVLLTALAGYQAALINEQAETGQVAWTLIGGLIGFAATRLVLHFTTNRLS